MDQNDDLGPCDAILGGPPEKPDHCGQPSYGHMTCDVCEHRYHCCANDDHIQGIYKMIRGHVVRMHPEHVPKKTMQAMLADPDWVAFVATNAAAHPKVWGHLYAYIQREKGVS